MALGTFLISSLAVTGVSLLIKQVKNIIQNIVGNAKASFSTTSDLDFVGMSPEAFEEIKKAINVYVSKIEACLDRYRSFDKYDDAFKGDVKTSVDIYNSAMIDLLQAYVTTMRQNISDMQTAYDNYYSMNAELSSNIQEDANELRLAAKEINLEDTTPTSAIPTTTATTATVAAAVSTGIEGTAAPTTGADDSLLSAQSEDSSGGITPVSSITETPTTDTPSGGGSDTPSGGGDTPSGGGDTPSGGGSDTPSGGGDTPSGGGSDTPSGGGSDTPSGGGDTPSGGGSDTPSGGGDTPSGGGSDTPSGGGDTPSGGGSDTPSGGGGSSSSSSDSGSGSSSGGKDNLAGGETNTTDTNLSNSTYDWDSVEATTFGPDDEVTNLISDSVEELDIGGIKSTTANMSKTIKSDTDSGLSKGAIIGIAAGTTALGGGTAAAIGIHKHKENVEAEKESDKINLSPDEYFEKYGYREGNRFDQ